jgi:hypothetical protein
MYFMHCCSYLLIVFHTLLSWWKPILNLRIGKHWAIAESLGENERTRLIVDGGVFCEMKKWGNTWGMGKRENIQILIPNTAGKEVNVK